MKLTLYQQGGAWAIRFKNVTKLRLLLLQYFRKNKTRKDFVIATMKLSTKIYACILFCLLGFIGNWCKLTLFFNVDFLFGSFFAMLAIMIIGGTWGTVVGIVAGTCTYFLWNHPWASIIFAAEALCVAGLHAKRKGNIIIYDMLFWLCLGIPMIYLFYHQLMGMQLPSTLVVMLKQSINGVFNALMASFFLILYQFMKKTSGNRMPYNQVLFVAMVSLVLLPSATLLVLGMESYQEKQSQALETRVFSITEAAQNIVADWVREHHRNVQILATLAGNPNTATFEEMQHYVEIIKTATPAFKGMGIFNRNAVTVSYSPLEEDGKPTVGVDFSYRPHVGIMRSEKKPYITNVLMSKLGNPSPIVIFLAPIIIADKYEGYCSGVVEVNKVLGLIRNLAGRGINISVIDGIGRVIVSTITNLKTMDPFPRPYDELSGARNSVTRLWQPAAEPNISYMMQWQRSFYYRLESLMDLSRWQVVVEASCAPLVDDISRYSLSRLGLLGLLILVIVTLSHFLSIKFIANVVRLQKVTRSLPARLDHAGNIEWPQSRIAELDELSNNFREMVTAMLHDITMRKKIEDELRYKNILLATQQEVSIEGILVVDSDDRIISFNRRFMELWAIPAELLETKDDTAVLGALLQQVADPDSFSEKVRYLYQHRNETSQEEMLLVDGRVFERYSAPMFGEDGVSYLGRVWYFRDVTERKQAEMTMQERLALQDQIAKVTATVPGMVCSFTLRPDGTTCMPFATGKIMELYGVTPEDVREDFSPVYKQIHPDDLAHLQESISESARTMKPWRDTYRICRSDTNEIWVEGHSLPQLEPDGSIVWHGFVMDITERKRAEQEREKLQTQLLQAQKMESVGRLAGGVAHDFNNMLGVILGHTEMAMDEMAKDHPLFNDLQEIRKAAERSTDLTRQLLAFARKQTISPKVVNLNTSVEGMLKMLYRLIGENVDLVWKPASDLWQVKMDPTQIDQIIANLCVNGRDAITDVGTITIATDNIVFNEAYSPQNAYFEPGDYVMLAVSDTGCGMDKETQKHIFEPFFSTKSLGKGTGLGLATIFGIVNQNNGFINFYSEPGQGTTFKIYLPRHSSDMDLVLEEKSPKSAKGGHETILVVEDEPTIMKMTSRMLQNLGYSVRAVGTPGEAITLVEECGDEIHLLITDLIMPGMNGKDLSMEILAKQPNMHVLFMSGYTADVIAHRGILDAGVNFIHKPFTKNDLAAKIRAILDSEERA